MEIKINFEKIHFWILLTAIVLIGGWIFVYAAGTQSHSWSEITNAPTIGVGTLTCQQLFDASDKVTAQISPHCPSGYILTGGGCHTSGGHILDTRPSSDQWYCALSSSSSVATMESTAICCKVQ